MKRIPIITLAIAGACIDSFFMYIGMITEGYYIVIAVTACLMVTGFSALLYYRKNYVLWAVVLLYSILSTNSGQYQLLAQYRTNFDAEQLVIDNDKTSLIKEQIGMKKDQIDSIDKERYPGWFYGEQKKLMALQQQLIDIKSTQKADTTAKAKQLDKFQFYSRGNKTAEAIIIFLFQLAFSVISSLCAPYALSYRDKPKPKKEQKPESKPKPLNKQTVARIMFSGYLSGKSKIVESYADIRRSLKLHKIDLSHENYNKLLAKLCKSNIIDISGHVKNDFAGLKEIMEAL